MKRKDTVTYELDPQQPAPLTAQQKEELERLAGVPDEQIDTSDIPPLPEAFWRNAVRNPFHRPIKRQVTVRLDGDVLAWLRAAGPGYQTKLNAVLRQAMIRELTKG
jgi:uncharacterized protein (DUF4415 family)